MATVRMKKCWTMRDQLREGDMSVVEYHILKELAAMLRWTSVQTDLFLDMERHELEVVHPTSKNWILTFQLRVFCHSKNVTVDYATNAERMGLGRNVVTILCDGAVRCAGWQEFIQLAMHLFIHNFNVLLLEPPREYSQDMSRWYSLAPSVLCSIWDFFGIPRSSIVAHGNSGGVFWRLMSLVPDMLRYTHILLNPRIPEDCDLPDDSALEKVLATNKIQLWVLDIPLRKEGKNEVLPTQPFLAHKNPAKLAAALVRMKSDMDGSIKQVQWRLKKNAPTDTQSKPYDEIIISDFVAIKDSFVHICDDNHIFVHSPFLLDSWTNFLCDPPNKRESDLLPESSNHPGLFDKTRALRMNEVELPALKALQSSEAEISKVAKDPVMSFLEEIAPTVEKIVSRRAPDDTSGSWRASSRSRVTRHRSIRERTSTVGGGKSLNGARRSHSSEMTDVLSRRRQSDQEPARVLVLEEARGPIEGEEMIMRQALAESQKAYAEDVRVREATAALLSQINPEATEDELMQLGVSRLTDEQKRQVRFRSMSNLES